MPEIVIADLPAATRARFGSDDAAQAALDAVLAAARRYCGWHVHPARTESLVLDGPGGHVLDLPSLMLTDVVHVLEDGRELDVNTLDWATSGPHGARIMKRSNWTARYRGVTATITHGYDEAPDWVRSIIEMVDSLSMGSVGSDGGPLKRKTVDDVTLEWFDFGAGANVAVYSTAAVLDAYKIEGVLFV